MAKHFYTDYAEHMLKAFFRNADRERNDLEKQNSACVERAVGTLTDEEKRLARFLYENRTPLPELIAAAAEQLKCDKQVLWNFNGVLAKSVAKERGLI